MSVQRAQVDWLSRWGGVVAQRATETEHAGAKKGHGAFWGHRAEAKLHSNRLRREDDKRAAEELERRDKRPKLPPT